MRKTLQLVVAASVAVAGLVADREAEAQGSTPESRVVWVRAEDGVRTHGVLVEPATARKDLALVSMHPRGNHGYSLQGPLAPAGFASLALVARHNTDLTFAIWEELPLDLAAGVKYMLDRGYKRIVLMGNSASGPLLTSYQDLAENADERTRWFGSKSYFFPKAAGLILSNPTPGHGVTFLRRLDPAVIDEATGKRDPALDLFNPQNWVAGDPKTLEGVRYSPEFLEKVAKAQTARMNRLMGTAEQSLARTRKGEGRFLDDEIIVVKGVWSHPCHLDLSLCATQNKAFRADPAVGPDGLGQRPVVNHKTRNLSLRSTAIHSMQSFLSFRAIRSTDPYTGLDFSTSNAVTPYHLGRVSVPILFLIATADDQVSPQDLDENYAGLRKGADAETVFIKDADHGFSKPDHLKIAAKGALDWLNKKFPASSPPTAANLRRP